MMMMMIMITMSIQILKADKTNELVSASDQFKRPINKLRGHKSIAKIRLDHRLTS